jgi:FkbM family methyltransferase
MFEPYTKSFRLDALPGATFRYATQQAVDWYDPMKPYTKLEYEWVLENVPLEGEVVVDGGAHHGHYSIVLGQGSKLIVVEPLIANLKRIGENLDKNGISPFKVYCSVITGQEGMQLFDGQENGRLCDTGAFLVKGYKLSHIAPDATVVKLDIEGTEFEVLPAAIDELPNVHSWIVEVHPWAGDANALVGEFVERGFTVYQVDRAKLEVVPFVENGVWSSHTTVMALRRNGDD